MIDPAFGHWFAGFVDGEGCFLINRFHGGRNYQCAFHLELRDDDKPVLEEIKTVLGVGKVFIRGSRSDYGRNGNPQALFYVQDKMGNLVIRDLLQEYPLRAKKAYDFQIWSKALDHCQSRKRGDSWEEMAYLKEQLEAGRKYRKP